MIENKFWLLLTEKQAQEKFLTKEYAINDARELAQKRKKPMYLMECVKIFDVDVNIVETSFEATPEDFSVVEPKFKIGDRVLLDNYYECVVDDYFDETKSYKLSIIGGGYNIAKEIRVTKK